MKADQSFHAPVLNVQGTNTGAPFSLPILTRIITAAVPRMICNYSSTTCTPMHPMPTVTVSRHTFPQSGSLTAFTRARPLRLAQPPCRLDLLPAGGSTHAVSGMHSLHTSPILMNHYLCDSAAETAVAVSAKNFSHLLADSSSGVSVPHKAELVQKLHPFV